MATIVEKFDSREFTEGDSPSLRLLYVAFGTEDATEIAQAVEQKAPWQVGALFFQNYTVHPLGGGVWDIEVNYRLPPDNNSQSGQGGSPQPSPDSAGGLGGPQGNAINDLGQLGGPGGGGGSGGGGGGGTNDFGFKWSYTFETAGGTQHITQSKATTRYPSTSSPDFQGAINVKDGDVNGVDIIVPVFKWTETHQIPIAAITPAYKANLFDLTGKVNGNVFRGFNQREVLFEGATGSVKTNDNWEFTFKFAASPHVINQTIGTINVTLKEGWEYLWVLYENGTSNDAIIKKPKAVYCERVYEAGDFTVLGLGAG